MLFEGKIEKAATSMSSASAALAKCTTLWGF